MDLVDRRTFGTSWTFRTVRTLLAPCHLPEADRYVRLSPIQTTERIQIAVDGPGPRFLGLTTTERNRRAARRAEERNPLLSGMLRIPDDVALTVSMFAYLPREGTWHIDWHPRRQPLAWQAEGTIGLPAPD